MAFAPAGLKPGEALDHTRCWCYIDRPSSSEDPATHEQHLSSSRPSKQEGSMAKLVPSPYAEVGTTTEPRQRVIQVCLGNEHGVLLTDAGIVFTYGDNRYGQLGRPACLKEENGQAFPVLALLEQEVLHIAAGRNHCLALTADGVLWGWGRNKSGQLGQGNTRDYVLPVTVDLQRSQGRGSKKQAPERPANEILQRVIAIGAGSNSSIAATNRSHVFQWGEISDTFTAFQAEKTSHRKKHDANAEHKATVDKTLPYLIAAKDEPHQTYRSRMRKDRVSIAETGCRVLDRDTAHNPARAKDLVEEIRKWQNMMAKERKDAEKLRNPAAESKRSSKHTDVDANEVVDLQDTIGFLKRDLDTIDCDIDIYEKNLKSCEDQQAYTMHQIDDLMRQGMHLQQRQGDASKALYEAKKSGGEKAKLEDTLIQINEFQEANQNTRMTLLEQRAETDKEKQHLASVLSGKKEEKSRLEKRLDLLTELSNSSMRASGASDFLVNFLQQEKDEIHAYFEGKTDLGNEFLSVKRRQERDDVFLAGIVSKMNEVMANASDQNPTRAQKVADMLRDLVDLRHSWNDMLADRWLKEDADLKHFFHGSRKLEETSQLFRLNS